MKLFARTVLGMLFLLVGMLFILLSLRQLMGGTDFWSWLGHVGQGVLIALVGAALIPETDIRDFLEQTFSKRR